MVGTDDRDSSEADALLARVAEADGELVLEEGFDRAHYERVIRQSLKSEARPRGKRLELRRQGDWRSTAWLVAYADHVDDFVEKRNVPVPERVGKYHPAVRAYLDDRDRHFVSKEHLQRAAKILQAVAAEAQRRGFDVPDTPKKSAGSGPHDRSAGDHLRIVAATGAYAVNIKEIAGTGGATIDYVHRYDRRTPGWLARRQTEFISTGRLELTLLGPGTAYGGNVVRDAKRSTVEDRLSDFFAAIDAGILRAQATAEAARRREEERKRALAVATERARVRFRQHRQWEHFQKLARDARTLDERRSFLERAVAAAEGLPEEQRATTLAYLDEMRVLVDKVDPLASPELLVPDVPEPTASDLQPFMGGLNPWGLNR